MKQKLFLQSKAREKLYSGAFGSGKSFALCLQALIRALHPGAEEFLVRKTLAALKLSTLRTLLKILPPDTFQFYKSESRVQLNNGGAITLLGCDDAEKLGSIEATGIGIDEATEVDSDEYTALLGRVRLPHPLGNQIYLASNPSSPQHHLGIRFGVASEPEPNTEIFYSATAENTNLPLAYIDSLSRLKGTARDRYYLGKWVAREGVIFDLTPCVIEHEEAPDSDLYGGIDFGWSDPFAALIASVYRNETGQHVVYVLAERYLPNVPIAEHAGYLRTHFPTCTFFADSEAPEAIREMRKADLAVSLATKRVIYGVDAVNRLIAEDRLFISKNCENLIKEASNYVWNDKASKEAPKAGQKDHACDALRYLVASLLDKNIIS